MPDYIGTNDLATLLGITPRRVQMLVKQGAIPKLTRGRYDPAAAIPAYCEFLRTARERQTGTNELQAEKLRLVTEQADKAALANAKLRGEVVSVSEVESAWVGIAAEIRATMLAVTSRAASRANLTKEAIDIVDAEIRAGLESLQ